MAVRSLWVTFAAKYAIVCIDCYTALYWLLLFLWHYSITATITNVAVRGAVLKYLELSKSGHCQRVTLMCESSLNLNLLYSDGNHCWTRYCQVPAMSAPVEHVFNQSGLIMRPNWVRLRKKLICQLVCLKYNRLLWLCNALRASHNYLLFVCFMVHLFVFSFCLL